MDITGSPTTEPRADADEATSPSREWAWKLRVLAIVVVFAIIAIARSRQVDIPFRDPHGKLFSSKILSTAETLLLAVAIDIVVRWIRGRRQGRSLWQTVRTRWSPYRIVMIVAALLAYQVVYLCYRNLKSW
ncbi:MAG TPA: PA-phosphatase, partial [Nocardioides sp.]